MCSSLLLRRPHHFRGTQGQLTLKNLEDSRLSLSFFFWRIKMYLQLKRVQYQLCTPSFPCVTRQRPPLVRPRGKLIAPRPATFSVICTSFVNFAIQKKKMIFFFERLQTFHLLRYNKILHFEQRELKKREREMCVADVISVDECLITIHAFTRAFLALTYCFF